MKQAIFYIYFFLLLSDICSNSTNPARAKADEQHQYAATTVQVSLSFLIGDPKNVTAMLG